MVKRNPPRRGRGASGIELFMECTDEALSGSQITAQQVAKYQYDQALAKIRDAQAKARIGKARIINKVDVGKVAPQPVQNPHANLVAVPAKYSPDRPPSPDIIFVGESPPPPTSTKQSVPVLPQTVQGQNQPQPRHLVVTTRSPTQNPALNQQQVYKLVNVSQPESGQWMVKPVANVMPQQQATIRPANQPIQETGSKRPLAYIQPDLSNKKKLKTIDSRKFTESDESGNWVPLDEYYYGKMEGDPTYFEEKNEYRFKCWYCNKMLYNNVKAMMHIQGHIDSSKQQNIDLSDLTQCKHCYKQFDTPFEMQTHVDKVHMSNSNVLLCRICDRDQETHLALTSHMRTFHKACEMPYTCQLCKFRSSMYSDVVDHFKKKHDSSQHMMCLYCLRIFAVKFVSQGWGTTQTYYGHLLKHQSKAQNKKCGLCRLSFFNVAEVKAHKQKHHCANHKAVLGTAAHTSKPDQLLIKVPSSQKNSLKSLNAPSVSKVLDFGGTTFPSIVHYYNCYECKMSMGTHDHYRKYVECSMCRFATICSIAYANHMMGFHSGQMSSLNLNIPWERKMDKPMYCLCGFSSQYGNKIANHLVFCMKSTCYKNKPEAGTYIEEKRDRDMVDPRTKAGASLLDALGLVQRRIVTPRPGERVYHRSHDSPSKETIFTVKTADPDYEPSESGESDDVKLPKSSSDAAEEENSQSSKYLSTENIHTKATESETYLEKTEKELLSFETEDSNEGSIEGSKIGDIIDALDEDKLLKEDEQEVKGSSDSGDMKVQGSSVSGEDQSKEQENSCEMVEDLREEKSTEPDEIEIDKETCEKENNAGQDENETHVGDDDFAMESKTSEDQESPCNNCEDLNNEVEGAKINPDSDELDISQERIPEISTEDLNEDEILKESEEEMATEQESKEPNSKTDEISIENVIEDEILKECENKGTEQESGESVTKTDQESGESVTKTDQESGEFVTRTDQESVELVTRTDQENSNEEANLGDDNNKEETGENESADKPKEETGDNESEDKPKEETGDNESDDKLDENIDKMENIETGQQPCSVEKPEICDKLQDVKVLDKEVDEESSEYKNEDELETVPSSDSHVTDVGNQKNDESGDRHVTDVQAQKEAESSSKVTVTKASDVRDKREDNFSSQRESPSKSYYSKDSTYHRDRRDDHSRGYRDDDRNYHKNRSHDYHSDHHRSYDDRRSHDRRSHNYDDRSYHHGGRQDDRNRHGGRHDRDRSYYDNRGYDRRDNKDYRHDDRRRGQGHYQGQGYGGGYHGYR